MQQTFSDFSTNITLAEMLIDCSIDRVMAIDNDKNIISWNQAAEIASGLAKNLVLGKNIFGLFPLLQSDKELVTAINGAFEGRKTFVPADRDKLHRNYYENHFIPLKDNQDKVVGVMNIMHDVAHRIKAETQLQELNAVLAEKYTQLEKLSDELTNFTSITTNNIREPLQFIYTSLELLMKSEGRTLADSSKANLRRMQSSLNRINRLIEDINELFKINSSTHLLAPLDLNIILSKLKQNFQRKITERDVKIHAEPLPTVLAIPEMILLLFQNIIDNAIKFQPDGQSAVITIKSEMLLIHTITHIPDPSGEPYIKLSFIDNGIGIPANKTIEIFGMFTQLHDKKKYPGSGLGLTFSDKIMQAHKGFIIAQSDGQQGSTFECYFPATPIDN